MCFVCGQEKWISVVICTTFYSDLNFVCCGCGEEKRISFCTRPCDAQWAPAEVIGEKSRCPGDYARHQQ